MMPSFKLKIILIGIPNSGGEKLITRFIKNRFSANYKLTVGVDILTKDVEYVQGDVATLSIWDIGGQQRFEFIRSTFYKGAAGALLVFDLTREQTYEEIGNWLSEIRQYTGETMPFVLIGNKIHLLNLMESPINREEIREFVKNEGGIYIETAPNSTDIVEEAFCELTRQIIKARYN
ncbi:MAG: GTP-binding protein [Candidatus Hodarchaeota archaeon]